MHRGLLRGLCGLKEAEVGVEEFGASQDVLPRIPKCADGIRHELRGVEPLQNHLSVGPARAELDGTNAISDEVRPIPTHATERVVFAAVDGEREASSPSPDAVQLPAPQNFGRESRQTAGRYLPNI